jgi:ubiquinone/menaquinone biosynthesis C-methylase UbiE
MWKTQGGWFEEWFDHPGYPVLYAHRDQTEADAWIDTLVRKVFTARTLAGPVLDCGCGHGRHARRLADFGIPTVGLDLSASSISTAQHHAATRPHLAFVQGDVRNLDHLFPAEHFTAALSLFTSFGYLNSPEEDEEVLHMLHKILQPGGLFVLDFLNVSYVHNRLISEEVIRRTTAEEEDWTFSIHRHESRGGFVKSIDTERNGVNMGRFEEFVRAYTPAQLTEVLERVGMNILRVAGDYSLGPLVPDAPRCIIVAEKS